ncbi:inner membrane-spanning protein YciB [Bdellovibrio sp. ZAP7]|uniref:inner membrane-spanning protein YciB n=1 Tax=Bdellovibrio sp. ZAP7 TaxID=2231053 RepID=UPI001FF02C36|nr:septation protein IspZ [Bdellovibrio sp. ZAP7]
MQQNSAKSKAMAVFFAGLLPVIAFTVIEDQYGTIAGLIAGMVFGVGEICFELYKHKKVQKITWIGNGLLLVLGGVSLISDEGIWFKMQPAIMEAAFAIALWVSWFIKKPLIVVLAEQQGQKLPEFMKTRMSGMTFRMGIFFAAHAVLATWAALHWSSNAWALLKGVGLTVSLIVYMLLEVLYIRRSAMKALTPEQIAEQIKKIQEEQQSQ